MSEDAIPGGLTVFSIYTLLVKYANYILYTKNTCTKNWGYASYI